MVGSTREIPPELPSDPLFWPEISFDPRRIIYKVGGPADQNGNPTEVNAQADTDKPFLYLLCLDTFESESAVVEHLATEGHALNFDKYKMDVGEPDLDTEIRWYDEKETESPVKKTTQEKKAGKRLRKQLGKDAKNQNVKRRHAYGIPLGKPEGPYWCHICWVSVGKLRNHTKASKHIDRANRQHLVLRRGELLVAKHVDESEEAAKERLLRGTRDKDSASSDPREGEGSRFMYACLLCKEKMRCSYSAKQHLRSTTHTVNEGGEKIAENHLMQRFPEGVVALKNPRWEGNGLLLPEDPETQRERRKATAKTPSVFFHRVSPPGSAGRIRENIDPQKSTFLGPHEREASI
uniref:C2H2-type domain-containing protein n=1 Tax=Chromera velia CCMP2878 TaxID=1169474 RepID=A0A0G4HHQ0_9ALVE|eukprot:Cvel_27556.t1-p1 / transcript=Cvel_27556.t1 / gene=Cvel_27556 / organism=Chromera_velia_CCMP2878 / gene_product=hypothetical protein / transcript_product=hypothetical protein / location=Cvel_scaffold3461:3652-6964(-) / protein_length=349 / sequence_SO=supercontig / SO=protein_coding / is_pseudo=false